ncbi:acyl-CoA dehydrogenase family protein [Rhodococcus koreensis]|uniref:acyl-CoA dehydrogenase family protein n=1 Tax=Rhodococcus koreensis TaxID=99653 RepID=UPI00366DD52C
MNGSADPELVFEEDSGPFLEAAEEFVRREISDNLERWREESAIPAEFFRKAGDTGLLGVRTPREFGGFGIQDRRFGQLSSRAIVGSGAFGLAWTLGLHSDVAAPTMASYYHGADHEILLRAASIGEKVLTVAGLSGGVRITQRAGRWRLDGVATAVPGAAGSDIFVVLATGDDGSLRVASVPSDAASIRESTTLLGASESATRDVTFDGVEVGDGDILDPAAAESLVAAASLLVGGIAVAAARFCIDRTVAYVNERSVFGRPVALFDNTRDVIAEIHSELLTVTGYHTALASIPADLPARSAESFSVARSGAAIFEKCADVGLQLHGGYGYMLEYPISHAYAAARYFRLVVDALPGLTETMARDAGLLETAGETRVSR